MFLKCVVSAYRWDGLAGESMPLLGVLSLVHSTPIWQLTKAHKPIARSSGLVHACTNALYTHRDTDI